MPTFPARHVSLRRAAGTFTPASSGFLALADSTDQAEILCVTLSIRAKGTNPALTVRLSDRDFTDTDGNRWNALIHEKSTLDAGGAHLESRWQPGDMDLVVADAQFNLQSVGKSFSDLLWQYEMIGTPVTVKLGAEGMATADWQHIFEGEVSEVADLSPAEVRLIVVQDRKWVRPVPVEKVHRGIYPEAPVNVVGVPIPLFFGNFSANRLLLANLPSPANKAAYKAGVARAPIPMVPIDTGTNGGTPAYLISSDEIYTPAFEYILIEDRSTRRLAGTTYCTVAKDAEGNWVNTLTGANFSKFDVAILAINQDGANTADNWQECSREDKDYVLSGYSYLDFDSSKKILRVQLPSVSELGEFKSASVLMWYAKNATSSSHPQFGLKHTKGDVLKALGAAASSTYPSDTPIGWDSVDVTSSITSWADVGGQLYVEVREAGSEVQVHRLVLLITFIPSQTVVLPGLTRTETSGQQYNVGGKKWRPWYTKGEKYGGIKNSISEPDVLSFDSPAYTYQVGVPDDGSGTYSGTPSAVIEHPASIAHYLLVNYGGLTNSNIVRLSNVFGSFRDIRTTHLPNYKAQVYIAEATDVEDVVAEVGRQFLIWFYRKLHVAGAPWVAIPWGVGSTVNYRSTTNQFVFTQRYVCGIPSVGLTPVSQVRNVVRVNYDYDLRTRTYAEQCFITDSDSWGYVSSAGEEQRDQATNREVKAAESVSLYGRREHTINLSMSNDPYTATSIRDRAFDMMYRPRVTVRFTTFLNACDLQRGQLIQLGDDFDALMPYPLAGSDGSWLGRALQVVRVTRRESQATTYDVEAIEA